MAFFTYYIDWSAFARTNEDSIPRNNSGMAAAWQKA
jgi:hypothetical protein